MGEDKDETLFWIIPKKVDWRLVLFFATVVGIVVQGVSFEAGLQAGKSQPQLVNSHQWCEEKGHDGGYYSGYASTPDVWTNPETAIKCYNKEDGNFTGGTYYGFNQKHEVVKTYVE